MNNQAEKIAGSDLTQIAEYTQTAMALAELKHRFAGLVVNVSTPKGLKEAKSNVAELRTLRTGLEAKRKEMKAPILERGKMLDDEAKRITAEIVALEEPIKLQVDAEESRIEAERLAKLEAERLRVEGLRAKIQSIREFPSSLIGKPAVIIAGQLEKLRARELDEAEYAELYAEASDALIATIARAQDLLAAQQEHESEQARIKAEREELDKLRREAEERRAEDERKAAEARAEADRLAAEERGRLAKEAADRRQAEIAEQAKRDAEERAEREKVEQAERTEQDRLRAERRAELDAEQERQDAERQRLEKERAEFARQQKEAEARAKADRLANLGLREAAETVVRCHRPGECPSVDDLAAVLSRIEEAEAKPVREKKALGA